MNIFLTRKILARACGSNVADKGCIALLPGQYQANKTSDSALEIVISRERFKFSLTSAVSILNEESSERELIQLR